MGRKLQIRKNAILLLDACKESLRYLRRQDPHPIEDEENQRQKLMALLGGAIEKAEPDSFDERDTSIRLVMTPKTWGVLERILVERSSRNSDDRLVYESVLEGYRETKQRIYLTLGINPVVLRRLQFILSHTSTVDQKKPFRRMAREIKEKGLSKNPMEILAEMGL